MHHITDALDAYETSVRKALLMTRIQALAESLDNGTEEELSIAYILRGIWIAAHQGHIDELYMAVDPLIGKWLDDSAHIKESD